MQLEESDVVVAKEFVSRVIRSFYQFGFGVSFE